jgi:hypothetical protein
LKNSAGLSIRNGYSEKQIKTKCDLRPNHVPP